MEGKAPFPKQGVLNCEKSGETEPRHKQKNMGTFVSLLTVGVWISCLDLPANDELLNLEFQPNQYSLP